MPDLILGSASPRRSELLLALKVTFEIDAPDIVERTTGRPAQDAERLAREKAAAVAARNPDRLVLAADTIVYGRGRSFGKPRDEADAMAMLSALSGTEHQVYTGLVVAGPSGTTARVSMNRVWLRTLRRHELERYVRTAGHMDKAGAYAIQDDVQPVVERFEGCHCSIMGLPLWDAYRALVLAGVDAVEPSRALSRCGSCPERMRQASEDLGHG